MPMVPNEEIERLKKEIPIQHLAQMRGIKLQPHGKDLIGLCPFHEDHEPSLVITPGKNLWNCLGACGTGGTVIDWVMRAEGVDFRRAVEILRGEPLPREPGKTTHPISGSDSFSPEDRELMNQVVTYYHETLKQSPEALSYLEKRGLKNPEMISRFKIGYANRTLGNRFPEMIRKAGAAGRPSAIRERLAKLGIIRESGHEHFHGCVVIPILDEEGRVTGMYGRKINDYLREGTAYHLYLPGPHTGVFNLQGLQGSKDVILCEALIDALTFWAAGIRNVTASYGVNGFTSDHLEAFRKYGIERVFIAYDRDQAGDNGAERLSRELIAEGFECFRILFPRGMDANEYALKVKPPEKSLAVVFHNATWFGKGTPAQMVIPEIQEKEPTAAAKGKSSSEETPMPESASQPSFEPDRFFYLVAETSQEKPPRPVLSMVEGPEPKPAPTVITKRD